MTATLEEIRDAFADILDADTAVRVHGRWPDAVNPPCIIVHLSPKEDAINYESVLDDVAYEADFDIVVVQQLGTFRTAYEKLDDYLSPTGTHSIPARLNAAKTLGGVVDTLFVRRGGYADIDIGGKVYACAVITVTVAES